LKVSCKIECPNSNTPNSQLSCHRSKNKWIEKKKKDPITCEEPVTTVAPTPGPTCQRSGIPIRVAAAMEKIGSNYVFFEQDFKFFTSSGIQAKLLCFNGRVTNKVKITCSVKKNGKEKWVIKGDPANPPGNCHVARKRFTPHAHWNN